MLRMALTILQLFASLAIIGLVLLQKGKGADAGAGFGAGASGTVFGARGARTALSRATAILAAVFMVNSLALAYMGTRAAEQRPTDVLDQAAGSSTPAPTPGTTPGAIIPAPAAQTPAPAPADAPPPAVEAPAVEAPQSGAPAPANGESSPTPRQ
jgi:preprotein translocase subunit SecG